MSIHKIRQLLLENRDSDGSMKRAVIRPSDLTLQESILVVCLMTYYLMSDHDVYSECMEIFKWYENWIKEERLKEHEDDVDDNFTVDMALADDLQEKMKEYLGGNATEDDLEVAVDRLMDYFFIRDDNDEEEGMSFDENDNDDDSFLDIDLIEVDDADDDR